MTDRAPHVVVCGLHDEGLRVVQQLHAAGVEVVVVDSAPDQRLLSSLADLDVPHIVDDSRRPEALRAAGLDRAAAVVCVESDDLHTLATALLARQLRPELRVVVQLRNEAVGRALEATGVHVLDVARLAAPAVVRACLRTRRWEVELGAQRCEVVEAECSDPGTLRSIYGDLSPIAVVRAGGGVEISPGRDVGIEPGDRVHLVGSAAEIAAAGLAPSKRPTVAHYVGARALRPDLHHEHRDPWLRRALRDVDRRVWVAVTALAGLALTSIVLLTAGYREPGGARMSPLDALYFTVETIGTVGYGDYYFRDQHWWLRVWAIALMVVGATLATVFFALLTNALITRRIEETLGRRRITGLSDHVIVVGTGSVGMGVVRLLRRAGVEVVVVEQDPGNRFAGELASQRVPVVAADATLPETWRDVRLAQARAVAVMTSDDLVNLEAGLAVRDALGDRWSRMPVVLRLFGRRIAATVGESFGFRDVRSPAVLAAPWFVGAALGLDVVDTFYVADQPLLLARLRVRGGGLDGVAMQDVSAQLRVLVLERADGVVEQPPRRDTRFRDGDAAYVVGPYQELIALLRADGFGSGLPAS